MYNYFPHPSNSRQSSGLVTLIMNEGYAGYGIYWAIIELLRDAPGYKYSSDPKVMAYVLHAQEPDQVARVLKNYGLFDFDDDGLMFSPWLLEQMGAYDTRKAKLSAAGKKGAAKRFGDTGNGDRQALATPSNGDGQAKAYNIILPNVTEPNITPPMEKEGKEWEEILNDTGKNLAEDFVELMGQTSPKGHNTGYIAQVCWHYGVGENTFNFLCERSNNADMTHPLYKKFCALVTRIQADKFHPKKPDAFFIKKLFE